MPESPKPLSNLTLNLNRLSKALEVVRTTAWTSNSGQAVQALDDVNDALLPALMEDLKSATKEMERLKYVAAYLAECHAANLHEAQIRSTSKKRRDRFKQIMLRAIELLKGEVTTPYLCATNPHHSGNEAITEAIRRLEDHAQKVPL